MVYRVIADGIDIFGSDAESSLLSPSLELELNSAGSFEFTLPPDHSAYDDISLMQSEIEVYEDGDLIFFGRPAEVNIDWNKQKIVTCEGALAYLNDAAIRPHTFEETLISDVFKYIIAQYNAQVTQDKQFIVGNITITDRYVYTSFDYGICLSVLISTCIDSTGGYLFLRKEDNGVYIDWLSDVPDASDQPVQFASNLLDLKQDKKAEDICTVVLPLGGDVDGSPLTIASVNDDSDILEYADGISLYGRILKIQTWNDILDAQVLKDKAQAWLEEQNSDVLTIEADAAELHYLDGSVGAYHIGQKVNVISGPHGIDKEVPILKMSMSLDSGVKKVTLGTPPRKELTELSGITNSTGGSGGSSGGGGGGGTSGVTDVLVNGSSVVSDHIARVSVPTDTVTSQQMASAISTATSGLASTSDVAAAVAPKANTSDVTAALALKADKTELVDVEANPQAAGTTDLEKLQVGNTVYNIPSGGSTTMASYYSTDEKIVGRWTDGKPVYQKTYHFSTRVVLASGVNENILQLPSEMVLISGIAHDTDYSFVQNQIQIGKNNGYLYIYNAKNVGVGLCDITLQYTKTTDTPGTGPTPGNLIYLPALYSEEEREVGVWKDGKPLYQKTIDCGTMSYDTNWHTVAHNISDVEHIMVVNGYVQDGTVKYWFSVYRPQYNLGVIVGVDTQNVQYVNSWLNSSAKLMVTIQYTKTTDTPGSGKYLPDGQYAHHYSTSEKVVGTWVDGSTIYERTWDLGSATTFPNNTWTSIVNNVGISINKIIKCEGVQNDPAAVSFDIWFDSSSNSLKARSLRDGNESIRYFTIQYTKSS